MTSKTFKSVVHGSSIQVHDNVEGVFIGLLREDSITRGTTLSKSDAPALALAVLEAAFGDDQPAPNKIGEAWAALYVHIAGQERATEAKEQAELEAEALELFNISQGTNLGAWAPLADRSVINIWVEIAKRAREIAGRAEK